MQLAVRDLIEMFGVSETTVTRWAKHEELPAQHVAGQLRFNRLEVLDWAIARQIKFRNAGRSHHVDAHLSLKLADALQAGGIHYGVAGEGHEAILRALISRLPLPRDFDRGLLLPLFAARVGLGSTLVGDGIAIPSAQRPIVLDVARPLATLCFLKHALAFPPDGASVQILFSVISPTVTAHVQLLARLSQALADPGFRKCILARKPREQLLRQARRLDEAELLAEATQPKAA